MKITEVLPPLYAGSYDWRPTFIIWPRKTISGQWAFCEKLYQRRLWVSWGHSFHCEPETQYARLLDMLNDPFSEMIKEAAHDK